MVNKLYLGMYNTCKCIKYMYTCINIHTNGSNDADDKKKGQLEEDVRVDVFLQLAALGPRPTVVEKCLCLVTWWVDIVNRLVEFTQAYCYNEWFYEVCFNMRYEMQVDGLNLS